ncbi:hypothetical protein PAXRUDRAFT_160890 [Paxillus rubicundulus Ve08.2h10]|uniref:Unplaced genomic scaffold scaffold_1410, whole genome shotgun sequence n=1 Tax=Paxillus rubicundulus Ve08.2h10 TaxID=930991 RepID=A0A0D0DF37_9AGAM|nr:hypothetical protein PAXRUDRAFT_160890 [Paxillus rubicundulus Ve08.2h10]
MGNSFINSLYWLNGPLNLPSKLSGLQKMQNQWHRWSQDFIPVLMQPYLSYLQQLNSLWSSTQVPTMSTMTDATCMCDQQCLSVTCIFFDHKLPKFSLWPHLKVDCCKYTPAPVCLINCRLFSSSPITPSLAVDL